MKQPDCRPLYRLADLKEQAQEHYAERLQWNDEHYYGGCSYANVDHHVVSVMVDPPKGQPHIAVVKDGKQTSLDPAPVQLALTMEV